MTDEPEDHSSEPTGGEPARRDVANSDPVEVREAWPLIADFFEGQATDDGLRRLEELVTTVPAVTHLYVRVAHLWCTLPTHLGYANTVNMLLGMGGTDADESDAMTETMIVRAVRDADLLQVTPELLAAPKVMPDVSAGSVDPPGPTSASRQLPGRHASRRLRWGWRAAAAVALALGGATLGWIVLGYRAAAVITAAAGATVNGSDDVQPDSSLGANQTLRVTRGAVELRFRGGAVVVVAAPAQLRVIDGERLALDQGSVVVHAPHRAAGFRIDAPGLDVVDQGTDFGVRTTDVAVPRAGTSDSGLASDLVVFSGNVDATSVDSGGKPVSAAVRVTAGHAVRHGPAFSNGPPLDVEASGVPFVHNVGDVRLPINAPGTGVGVAEGRLDPAWQVVAVPDQPEWTPQPAVVMSDVPGQYSPNTADGQWISYVADASDVPPGDLVFRTRVDLTGLDPTTVTVTARASADDGIVDVRLNGMSTGATIPMKRSEGLADRYALSLSGAPWKSGVNQVDVVVHNLPSPAPGNYAGLNIAWTLTACPPVRR